MKNRSILLFGLWFFFVACTSPQDKPKSETSQNADAKKEEKVAVKTSEEKAIPDMHKFAANPALAVIGDKVITLDEIKTKRTHDLMNQLHEGLQADLPRVALKMLKEKHPEMEIVKAPTATPEQISAFYKQNNLESRGPLAEYQMQIKTYLETESQMELDQEMIRQAVEKGWMSMYLTPPTEMTVQTEFITGLLRGNQKASVAFLEFSDYQCPYCSRVQGIINTLVTKYGDRVAFGYRHFPLSFHTEADDAANAAECAGEQNKFLEYHEMLYANQRAQMTADLKNYARQLKIPNLEQFDKCLESNKYGEVVSRDMKAGAEIGVSGTPGFVIGSFNPETKTIQGEVISGALPLAEFERALNKYLNKKS